MADAALAEVAASHRTALDALRETEQGLDSLRADVVDMLADLRDVGARVRLLNAAEAGPGAAERLAVLDYLRRQAAEHRRSGDTDVSASIAACLYAIERGDHRSLEATHG